MEPKTPQERGVKEALDRYALELARTNIVGDWCTRVALCCVMVAFLLAAAHFLLRLSDAQECARSIVCSVACLLQMSMATVLVLRRRKVRKWRSIAAKRIEALRQQRVRDLMGR